MKVFFMVQIHDLEDPLEVQHDLLNLELFFPGRHTWKNQNKYLKFEIRHVQVDELPRTKVSITYENDLNKIFRICF